MKSYRNGMNNMSNEIRRGEIYWVDWTPSRGSEESGRRPSLIIQNDIGNKYSPTTIVAALTTAVEKPYPFMVRITAEESGLKKDSSVNLGAILTVDRTRLVSKCGTLRNRKMAEVDTAIKASLGL
jgi:mRNA interferase MazF